MRTTCPPEVLHGLVSNFEIKSFDGCANPYLGLAAVIVAGIDGLRRHLPLPEPVCKIFCLANYIKLEFYFKVSLHLVCFIVVQLAKGSVILGSSLSEQCSKIIFHM